MSRLLCVLLLLPTIAAADETAQFLKLGVGARALGLGGAYTAVADDANSIYWNPAGLANVRHSDLSLMHAELGQETHYDVLGFGQATSWGNLGLGVAHLGQASIQGRDDNGRLTSAFKAQDTAVILGYATVFGKLGLGVAGKFISSSLADSSAHSAALDLGGSYLMGREGPGAVRLAAAIQNLGPGMKFAGQSTPLPLTLAAGVAYQLPVGLTLAADFKSRPHAGSSEINVGTEYALLPVFSIRSGYASSNAAVSNATKPSALAGFAAGFGVKAYGLSLDYSMTPFGQLGTAQRLSLGAKF